ncbi:MAG: S8 family serine peptidase [Planctomycetes bacterium]|nr:S8 family serine peptidase [Planctomycetota bacterium]
MAESTRRVVVIDSGVDAGHPGLRGRLVLAGPAFADDGAAVVGGAGRDELGHGTAIAVAILAQAPACELLALRVFDAAPQCAFERVLAALTHALEQRPAVVNLSLGTTSLGWREPLQNLLATARAQGTRIVAPATFAGLPCAPGNLPGADGVIADPNVPRALPIRRRIGGAEFWFASPVPPPGPDGVTIARARGESLATAHVSAWLMRSLPW